VLFVSVWLLHNIVDPTCRYPQDKSSVSSIDTLLGLISDWQRTRRSSCSASFATPIQ